MRDAASRITIAGDLSISSDQHSVLNDGEITLMGDFTQLEADNVDYNFEATGSHKVILAGTGEQLISFATPYRSRFANLHISNESGNVRFITPLMINKGLTYSGDVLTVDAFDLIAGVELTHDITIQLPTSGVTTFYSGNIYLQGHTLTINGDLKTKDGGTLNVGDGELLISGDLIQGDVILEVGSGLLDVAGDYRIQNESASNPSDYVATGGTLTMYDDNGKVKVAGDFFIERAGNFFNRLSSGEMILMGDFSQLSSGNDQTSFQASGSHKVILAGSGEQLISFETPGNGDFGSHFADLHISNESGNVRFLTPLSIGGELTYSGDVLTVDAFDLISGLGLTHDITIQLPTSGVTTLSGNIYLYGHTLTINGDLKTKGRDILSVGDGELLISGDFIQGDVRLEVGSGLLDVAGDYRIQNESASNPTDYVATGGGTLTMYDDNGKVKIAGDFFIDSGGYFSNNLSAGEMILMGDFTQLEADNVGYNFQATGSHKVILAGTGEQLISFATPGDGNYRSRFANLHISNESGNVRFLTPLSIGGELTYSGDVLTVDAFDLISGLELTHDITVQLPTSGVTTFDQGSIGLDGHTLTINGDLKTKNGGLFYVHDGELLISGDFIQGDVSLEIGSGLLDVAGDYRIQNESASNPSDYVASVGTLTMFDDNGKVKIAGDFFIDSGGYFSRNLTAGEMILMGDFSQLSSGNVLDNFEASGSHKVILAGSGEQRISFEDPSESNFAQLYINNNSTSGVDFTTAIKVTDLFEHHGKQFTLSSAVETNFTDYDGDGVRDHLDPLPQDASVSEQDEDGDGVDYHQDAFPNDGTAWSDDDNDGMPDTWEIEHGFNPLDSNDATLDADGDGVSNLEEYQSGTNPNSLIPSKAVILPIIIDMLLD